MSRAIYGIFLTLGLLLSAAEPAPAQFERVDRAAIGGAVGVAGGAAITLAIVVARARFQREYLDSPEDLIHWQSTPMIAAPAVGVIFGLASGEALRASMIGSTTGLLAGAAVGAGLGWLFSRQPEGPWAGGVIGGALGLTVGGLAGGLSAWSRDDSADIDFPSGLRLALSVPLP